MRAIDVFHGGIDPTCPQEFGADLDAVSPKGWTPLSYCKAKGKYGATEEKGIYPEVSALAYSVTQ